MSNKNPFKIITTPNTKTFSFEISAAGKFTIDWGDNNIETIEKTDTNSQIISYKYDRIGKYIIKLDGKAAGYNKETSAIIFKNNKNLEKIDGSLGMIFSTLPNGEQPIFLNTFAYCYNLAGNIPEKLFAGIKGAPAVHMFNNTFSGCSELTGPIPEKLFAGIKGAPKQHMFFCTFFACSNLAGSIPKKLFAGISGKPAQDAFRSTFFGCSKMSGTMNEHGIITDIELPEPTEKAPLKSIPVADTTMNSLNKIDVIISGIAPDDLAKIIQSVQKVSNDINIKIAKQVQETNQKQH